MSERFQNKYRIKSARLPNWNYGWNADYFITICTKNRECFFGNVVNGKMILNQIGAIANSCWLQIPEHFDYVLLENHVIMPNHMHGIIRINKPNDEQIKKYNATDVESRFIATNNTKSIKIEGGITGNNNPMLHENLSRIIRWYKGRTTFEARKIQTNFAWQSRFHDHIIRNDESFYKISEYIKSNPSKWDDDQFRIRRD